MRVSLNDGVPVGITLSQRNLLSLLVKLDEPNSQRTLVHGGTGFFVAAQANSEHYVDRVPGPIHPRDESRLRLIEDCHQRLVHLAGILEDPDYDALQARVVAARFVAASLEELSS